MVTLSTKLEALLYVPHHLSTLRPPASYGEREVQVRWGALVEMLKLKTLLDWKQKARLGDLGRWRIPVAVASPKPGLRRTQQYPHLSLSASPCPIAAVHFISSPLQPFAPVKIRVLVADDAGSCSFFQYVDPKCCHSHIRVIVGQTFTRHTWRRRFSKTKTKVQGQHY